MVIQHQSRFASFQHGTVAPSPLFNRIDEPMRETSTGVANPAVIDLFGVDQKTGEVLLVMNEPRPWNGSHQQLHEMQEKFNAYASFILDGEMTEAHPELAGRIARIQLRCEYTPGKEALALLQAIHDQLELQAIRVEVVVADRSYDDQCGCNPEPMGETSQLMIAYHSLDAQGPPVRSLAVAAVRGDTP